MKILKTKAEIRQALSEQKSAGKRIGFVPTMGYLHTGHLSLMDAAKGENDLVVVSIFVNPAQFGPNEDYDTYPRDFARDCELAKSVGVDYIFAPSAEEMYPENFQTFVNVSQLGAYLCGAKRPVFFQGVCTVVTKLFNIVQPHRAYFGQKDAQQAAIIQRIVADLDLPVKIRVCPIVREDDGLAMSSRNKYLSPQERKAALVLFRTLKKGEEMIVVEGLRHAQVIQQQMVKMIENEPLARIDYVEIVSAQTLEPIQKMEGRVLIALAVFIGKTRLIDNILLEVE